MLRIVKTEYGAVRGIPAADPRITAFRGIPFASPPTGELRWHAPIPPKKWDGVRDCLEFAPISMQYTPGLNKNDFYSKEWHVDPDIPMSEDCLYLNVWTPAESPDEKLPVFVWYFGGGLQCGYTSEMEFDGERIARRGIVVVSVNYRVNVFGFLSHPEITKESPDSPANFGHLDQRAGLLWTYRNIAAFGGDPNKITIGGQSAGGMSVMTQLNCAENRPYIKGAIVDSGIFLNAYGFTGLSPSPLSKAEADGEKFFEHLGVKTLKEARAMDARDIFEKFCSYHESFFGSVIDGKFIKAHYFENIASGNFHDVPLLVGHTNSEFSSYLDFKDPVQTEDFAKNFFNDEAVANEFFSLIDQNNVKASTEFSSIEFAFRFMNRKLRQNGASSPHYYYEFGPHIPGDDDPGAFHSCDLWFWFETLAKCLRPYKGHHYDLARQMCNYWCEFIKKGDPNGNDADGEAMEHWETFTEENNACMGLYSMPELYERKPKKIMEFMLNTK